MLVSGLSGSAVAAFHPRPIGSEVYAAAAHNNDIIEPNLPAPLFWLAGPDESVIGDYYAEGVLGEFPGRTEYLAVRLNIGSALHYGWVHFEVAGGAPVMNVLGY